MIFQRDIWSRAIKLVMTPRSPLYIVWEKGTRGGKKKKGGGGRSLVYEFHCPKTSERRIPLFLVTTALYSCTGHVYVYGKGGIFGHGHGL